MKGWGRAAGQGRTGAGEGLWRRDETLDEDPAVGGFWASLHTEGAEARLGLLAGWRASGGRTRGTQDWGPEDECGLLGEELLSGAAGKSCREAPEASCSPGANGRATRRPLRGSGPVVLFRTRLDTENCGLWHLSGLSTLGSGAEPSGESRSWNKEHG